MPIGSISKAARQKNMKNEKEQKKKERKPEKEKCNLLSLIFTKYLKKARPLSLFLIMTLLAYQLFFCISIPYFECSNYLYYYIK
jgi:hypothetical protein